MTNILSLVQKMVCNFVLLSRPWFSLHLCFFRKPKRSCKNHNFNDQFKLLVVVFFISCQHLQSQETAQFNLTDNSPNKNKFLRACTQISFKLYLIIIFRRTCTWIYQEY